MFSHIMVGSNDIARSKKFYDALFVAMGAQPATEDANGRLIYTHNGGRFMVSKPIDGKPASNANGGTIGFTMSSQDQAAAWHKAGVANGGKSIEDAPGVRRGVVYLALSSRPRRQQAGRGLSSTCLTRSYRDKRGPPFPGGPCAEYQLFCSR
jgi:hypothetical protein